jgi:hypothetical protein
MPDFTQLNWIAILVSTFVAGGLGIVAMTILSDALFQAGACGSS